MGGPIFNVRSYIAVGLFLWTQKIKLIVHFSFVPLFYRLSKLLKSLF